METKVESAPIKAMLDALNSRPQMKSDHLRDARLIASTFIFALSLSLSACAPALRVTGRGCCFRPPRESD